MTPLDIALMGRVAARGAATDTDAAAWAAAVTSAGGTYSAATLSAVSAFCVSAKANGYWTKLVRINLFCGDQLAAALVPLKVGGGNATETNVGSAFVSGDYTESTGLKGDGGTKALKTGIIPATHLTLNDTHLAIYNRSSTVSSNPAIGVDDGSNLFRMLAPFNGDSKVYSDQYNQTGGAGRVNTASAIGTPYGHLVGSRAASNSHAIYRNGSSVATASTTGGALPTRDVAVFGQTDSAGGVPAFNSYRLGAYSIGAGLSSTDAANYYTDMQAFQTALGRNV